MPLEELQNGRYRRLRLLGTGGMGEVYLMEDVRVNRQVAIKVIRSEATAFPDDDEGIGDAARLFQREAKAIAALEHPNILPLYDFGEEVHDDVTITYMVMPFCADGSLGTWLKQRARTSRLSPRIVAHFVEQAADALQYAHDQQIVHLDVKPSNFLLRSNKRNPSRPTLLLADFGIARSFTTVSSSSHTIRGTPTSMAPEQWSGSPVAATDQYALAVMTYEMLAGRPPFIGSMEQLMYRHFAVAAPAPSSFNPQLPAAIDSVLLKALTKKPEERFTSIIAFASAFEEAVRDLSTNAINAVQTSKTDVAQKPSSGNQTESVEEPGLSQKVTIGETDLPTQISASVLAQKSDDLSIPDRKEPPTPAATLILASSGSIQAQETSRLIDNAISATSPRNVEIKTQQQSETIHEKNSLPAAFATVPVVRSPERVSTARKLPLLRVMSIILSATLVILLAGSGIYYLYNLQQSNDRTNANALSRAETATAQVKVMSTPTSIATPSPGLYIAGRYNGTTQNQTTGQIIHVSINILQKKGDGTISGSMTVDSVAYMLNGKVDQQGKISFSVQQSSGQVPLYFYGTVYQQSDGMYMHGNYCNSGTNSCSADTGFFNVGPRYS